MVERFQILKAVKQFIQCYSGLFYSFSRNILKGKLNPAKVNKAQFTFKHKHLGRLFACLLEVKNKKGKTYRNIKRLLLSEISWVIILNALICYYLWLVIKNNLLKKTKSLSRPFFAFWPFNTFSNNFAIQT